MNVENLEKANKLMKRISDFKKIEHPCRVIEGMYKSDIHSIKVEMGLVDNSNKYVGFQINYAHSYCENEGERVEDFKDLVAIIQNYSLLQIKSLEKELKDIK